MFMLPGLVSFNNGYSIFRSTSQGIELLRDVDNNPTPPNSARRVFLVFQAVIVGLDIMRVFRISNCEPVLRVPLLLAELGARVVNLGIGVYLLSRGHQDPLLKTNIMVNAVNISKLALVTFAVIKLLSTVTFPLIVALTTLNCCDFVFRANAWIKYRNNAIFA